jgi:hypothetical protein
MIKLKNCKSIFKDSDFAGVKDFMPSASIFLFSRTVSNYLFLLHRNIKTEKEIDGIIDTGCP